MPSVSKTFRIAVDLFDEDENGTPERVAAFDCQARSLDELTQVIWNQVYRYVKGVSPQEAAYYLPRTYLQLRNTSGNKIQAKSIRWVGGRSQAIVALVRADADPEDAARAEALYEKKNGNVPHTRTDPVESFTQLSTEFLDVSKALEKDLRFRLLNDAYTPPPLVEIPTRPPPFDASLLGPGTVSLSLRVPLGAVEFVTEHVRSAALAFTERMGSGIPLIPVHRDMDPIADEFYWDKRTDQCHEPIQQRMAQRGILDTAAPAPLTSDAPQSPSSGMPRPRPGGSDGSDWSPRPFSPSLE